MNGESFYDSFHEWHPPSPRSTPHSAKFGVYQFQSPNDVGSSPLESHHGWMTSQPSSVTPIGRNQPYPGQDTVGRPTSSKRQRPQSSGYSPVTSGTQQNASPAFNANYLQGAYASGSFIERFDSTTLDDPYTGPPAMAISTSATQMHTPPPTRDESTRRKPQQPRLAEFQTPSTIVSRRMSVPNDAWQNHTSDVHFPNPSPYSFTPLQLSPPPSDYGFTHSGSLTAPAYPQSTLFWDPHSNHQTLNPISFSTVGQDSFDLEPSGVAPSWTTFEPPQLSSHRITTSESVIMPTETQQALPRPNSARPADLGHAGSLSKASFISTTSSVDPAVLWNTQNADSSSFPRPASADHAAMSERRQPYQHQLESLRREKEERARRTLKVPGLSNANDLAQHAAQRSLRRSSTDSRVKRSGVHSQMSSQASSSDGTEPAYNLNNLKIPHEASPLKRHKPESQSDQMTPTKPRMRTSVVLVVDEMGNARTEVKPVAEDTNYAFLLRGGRSFDRGSDSSEPIQSAQQNSSIQSNRAAKAGALGDAQDALREVVRLRNLNRPDFSRSVGEQNLSNFPANHPYSSLPSSASKSYPNAGSSHNNNSPTTITDPEFQTPTRGGKSESSGNIRCLCTGRVPEERANLMIECESCKNWLHVACLGIKAGQIPQVFVCVFCSTTPGARGARNRTSFVTGH